MLGFPRDGIFVGVCVSQESVKPTQEWWKHREVPPEKTVYYRMVYLNAVALAGRLESVEDGRLR